MRVSVSWLVTGFLCLILKHECSMSVSFLSVYQSAVVQNLLSGLYIIRVYMWRVVVTVTVHLVAFFSLFITFLVCYEYSPFNFM